ncbi:helix-turn-helix domain-containing protein [Tuberibacillus sp. Marseille-P3662]|uniref:helix-turn-helix domain-containing protein n=1 Tax=Tuberibacillus sp. Marseille-P3662 TaxID=1965358 RepID=UPI000A1CF268|nr:helix-turn-helix domain-containing protein [Tuberibacillus sp. Marseille-P3662]
MNNPLDQIMSTREAAQKWGITQDSVKRLARQGQIIARKLDPDDKKSPYVILKNQEYPEKEVD